MLLCYCVAIWTATREHCGFPGRFRLLHPSEMRNNLGAQILSASMLAIARNKSDARRRQSSARIGEVDMGQHFSFGRSFSQIIKGTIQTRERRGARHVDKTRRSESTAGCLAPFGTGRAVSQHECRCITQNARAARDPRLRRRHRSKPRRRPSAQVRAYLASSIFRRVGFAMTTHAVLRSPRRKVAGMVGKESDHDSP